MLIGTDASALLTIGERIRQVRLNQNVTQAGIASSVGVALNVLKQLENGSGCTLRSFVRVLRALGKLDQLDLFLPDPGVSPLQLFKLQGRLRKEASGNRGRKVRSV